MLESESSDSIILKSTGTVTFIALEEMSSWDWENLEYPFLRNKAKARIADLIASGSLIGFYHVNIVEKAKGKTKPHYHFPATKDMVDKHGSKMALDDAEFFHNTKELEDLSSNAEYIDEKLDEFSNRFLYSHSDIISIVALAIINHNIRGDDQKELKKNSDRIRALDEKQTVPYEYALLAIIYLLRNMTQKELENLLEEWLTKNG